MAFQTDDRRRCFPRSARATHARQAQVRTSPGSASRRNRTSCGRRCPSRTGSRLSEACCWRPRWRRCRSGCGRSTGRRCDGGGSRARAVVEALNEITEARKRLLHHARGPPRSARLAVPSPGPGRTTRRPHRSNEQPTTSQRTSSSRSHQARRRSTSTRWGSNSGDNPSSHSAASPICPFSSVDLDSTDERKRRDTKSVAVGSLGIACPGNRSHSDAIFGHATRQ